MLPQYPIVSFLSMSSFSRTNTFLCTAQQYQMCSISSKCYTVITVIVLFWIFNAMSSRQKDSHDIAGEAQVHSWVSLCAICGQSGTGTGFCQSSSVFPIIIILRLQIHSCIIWGMDSGPISSRSSKETQSHPIITAIT
jgi:hypothetical protein